MRLDRRLTQVGLATQAGITDRYLEMLESGTRTPSLPVMRRLAKVLRVRTSMLVGELPHEDQDQPATFRLAAVERALCTYPTLTLTDHGPPDLGELSDRVSAAWDTWTRSPAKYSLVLDMLPGLVADVELLCAATGSSPPAGRQAVEVYQLARAVSKHAGRPDLGRVIADRSIRYAEATGSPALIALAHWNLIQTMLTGDMAEAALELSMLAIERLEPQLGDGGVEALSVYGGLIHAAAISAARTGDPWKARNLLRGPARRAAERVGRHQNHHHLAFGPSTHLYQVARAYENQGNDTAVLIHLTRAERLCPEDFRYKRSVRAMVTALVRRAKPSYSAEVREFAEHIGVLSPD